MKIKVDQDMNVHIVNEKWRYVTIIIAFASLIGSIIYLAQQEENIKIIYKHWVSVPEDDLPIKEEAWVTYLVQQGCVLPNICIAQAKVESGFCKSNVARKAHNPFGITYHKCKYVEGKHGVYAKYKTWKDAINCYIHIQDNYLRNIDGRYATDPNYVKAIRKIQ
jgi:uncharacterized FlgJ-related protein